MASLGGSFASLPWVLLVSRALEGMAFVKVVVANAAGIYLPQWPAMLRYCWW